jgi:hypothetical protein
MSQNVNLYFDVFFHKSIDSSRKLDRIQSNHLNPCIFTRGNLKGGTSMAEGARPGAATGAAIIEIIFGGIGTIVSLIGLFASFGLLTIGGIAGIISLIQGLLGLVVCVIGLVAGIMLISNKRNGMSMSPIWIWGTIVLFVLGIISGVVLMSAVTSTTSGVLGAAAADLKAAGADLKDMTAAADLSAASSAIGIGAAILGAVWGLIWQVAPAIIVLILLGMKPVKEFYAKAA